MCVSLPTIRRPLSGANLSLPFSHGCGVGFAAAFTVG